MGGIHPSALYSKEMIINALLSYMRYRDFSDIKITEITRKAGVARKTFYRHFSSKKDIIEMHLDSIFHEYLKKAEKGNNYEEVIHIFFELMIKHIDFFELLYTHDLSNMVLKKLEYYLSLLNKKPKYRKMEKPLVAYCETYSAGGLWKILTKWIKNGLKESVTEITKIYLELTK
ncbi:TetR/AcrR family transcriptional regulator [Listeria monocytogenes]|nr:TetR/AcrR family transcriptional regulator [Listeria monocytogenes]EHT9032830.1 TetR/AcrR family transcriptional regulator [Listeria monocytogenes]MCN75681.1 TetR/AcrR family transcriptional regulator [Listeria monocytogenes]